MAAPAKVFATYELLEHVLLHLPLRQLLLSQRINKACYDVISSSSDIHRALFWKPSAPPLTSFGLDEYLGELEWRESEEAESVLPMVNPFIAVDSFLTGGPHHTIRAKRLALVHTLPSEDIYGFRCARALPDAPHVQNSLDKMQLTHPPVGMLRVEVGGVRSTIHVDIYGLEDDEEDEEMEESNSGDDKLSDAGDAETEASDDSALDNEADDNVNNGRMQTAVGNEVGTTHGELLQFASLRWEGACKKSLQDVLSGVAQLDSLHLPFYDLPDAADWAQLKRSVDEITGWEMLHLLGLSEWDRMSAMRMVIDS